MVALENRVFWKSIDEMELWWIFLTLFLVIVDGKPPSEILQFSINCGTDVKSNNPSLNILTDVAVAAVAKCHGGDQPFVTTDNVHYTVQGSLVAQGNLCRLNQRENSDVYAIDVLIQYGEVGSMILTKKKIFSAVCTYTQHGKDKSSRHEIIDGPVAPIEWQTIIGKTIPSGDLKLSIQTVDDKDVAGNMNIDRKYSIYGVYTGSEQNVGLKPVSCNAVSRAGERYAVLRAGCGDGLIFERNQGFKTTGLTFRSPYFEAFYLGGSADLSFECNVTLCSGCDGSSCETVCGAVTDHLTVTNGSLSSCLGNNKYGDACTFACDIGFDIDAGTNGTTVCGADGIWKAPTIHCTPKDCGRPTAPTNGLVASSTTTYTHTSSYTCNPGYDLVGTASITCLNTGIWATAPTCRPKDCGAITTPTTNAALAVTSTLFPSTANLTCDAGYRIAGSNNSVGSEIFNCLTTGSWDTLPTCGPKDCGNFTNTVPNSQLAVPSTLFPNQATITCNAGYRITGAANQVRTRSFACLNTGSWAASPTCEPKNCGNVTHTDVNSIVSVPSTLFPNQATVTCNTGYRITGAANQVRTRSFACLTTGSWAATPTCELKDCQAITTATPNAVVTLNGTSVGGQATITCNSGYRITSSANSVAAKVITCINTGSWPAIPTCEPKDCGVIAPISNAAVQINTTRFGGQATITCATGYRITGSANSVGSKAIGCLNTGIWATIPTCERKDCGAIVSATPNAAVGVTSTRFAASATLTCSAGYRITGSANSVGTSSFNCLNTGLWAAIPTCERKDCGAIVSATPNATVSVTSTRFAASATLTCAAGYRITGNSNVTTKSFNCLNTGLWAAIPTCTRTLKCTNGYVLKSGIQKCIKVYTTAKSWSASNTQCKQDGGRLTIMIPFSSVRNAFPVLDKSTYFWVGGRKIGGVWRWLTNAKVTIGWHKTQPNNDGSCLRFQRHNKRLYDINCSTRHPFICEILI